MCCSDYKLYFLLGLLCYLGPLSFAYAQNKQLSPKGIDDLTISYEKIVANEIAAKREMKSILSQLHSSSYLSARIDSIKYDTTEIIPFFKIGDSYQWVSLSKGNLPEEISSKVDLSGRLFLNRPFNNKQLNKLFKRTIEYYENNGYPFASVRLDSIQFPAKNKIKAALNIEENTFYKIDSILIEGKSGINRSFLLQSIELQPGMPFNESKIQNISKRIREIPFISEKSKHEVQYFENGVKIIIKLEKKKASRFDGVLGLLTNADNGRIELTGDVDLNLMNSFNRGESIGLNWRKLQGNSQDLNLDFQYPYFLKTPFGIDFNFKLFKRDTTFLDLNTRLGVNYIFKRGESVTFFIENKSSSLLSRNSLIAINNPAVPALGDVRINSFGIQYEIIRYDYKYNPTKGFRLSPLFSVGRKELKKIASLETENPTIYDDVELKTIQFNGGVKANYFFPIAKRSTIKIANQSASVYSENLYQNELLRIGGLKILRGFDEESINASTYSIFTLEYRFLLDRNSYFSLFTDGGYYENNNVEDYDSDTPYGIGAGISFETNSGIFTFNYAVGKQFDNPLQFRAAKIHFGFVNFF